jgi:GST-like protein
MSDATTPSDPDLELVGAKTGNCIRAAIGLSEAGLRYRVRRLDLQAGEQHDDAHLALNPAGKVPVLVASGAEQWTLTQSNAILFYAAARAHISLLPSDGDARNRVLEAFFFFTQDVISVNGAAFRLKSRGCTDAYEALTDEYLTALRGAERFLSANGFMGDDRFSVADIVGYAITRAVADHLPWPKLERLAGWYEKIAGRSAVQSGLAAFD